MGAILCCNETSAVGDDRLPEREPGIRSALDTREFGPAHPHQGPQEQVILHPVRSAVLQGEDKLSGSSGNSLMPRCDSYYTLAVNPPPATPRCTSFLEVALVAGGDVCKAQTGPSETTTRLPSLPEDEMHCAPEPCKWDPVFLGLMLMHLDKAEDLAYGAAFDSFAGDDGDVPLESRELREFLVEHSVLAAADLDSAIRGAASEDGVLELAGFLDLLRDNAVERSSCKTWFDHAMQLGTCPGEDLTKEACLAGLRLFVANEAQRLPETALEEKQLERICTSAMEDAPDDVSFEVWSTYCSKAARTITLANYASDCNGF